MKKITKKTINCMWKCPHCSSLNNLETTSCSNCGAPRDVNSELIEVTTDFERKEITTTIATTDFYPSKRRRGIIILTVVIFALVTIISIISMLSASNVTVTDKYWKYTVTVSKQEYEHQTSTMTPPPEAINITPKQVRKTNGWSQVQYEYDIIVWKVVANQNIYGRDSLPTFKEYKLDEGEKATGITDIEYYVTFVGSKGTRTMQVSESEWLAYIVGNTYTRF